MKLKHWLLNQVSGDAPAGGASTATTTTTTATAPGTTQGQTQTPPADTPPANPMQAFNEMVRAATTPQQPPQTSQVPQPPQAPTAPTDHWALSQDNMRSSAKAISDALTTTMDQGLVTQALQGDTQAFYSVIGNAMQLAYLASVQQATAIAKNAVGQQFNQFDSGLESKFSSWQTQSTVMGDPRMADPAIAAMVNPMIPMIRSANPGATPAQLSSIVGKMLDAMGATLGAKPQQATQPTQQQDQVNWSAIFGTKGA